MYLRILHGIGGFTTASPCNQIPATIYAFVFSFLLPRMRKSNKTVLLLIRKITRSDITCEILFSIKQLQKNTIHRSQVKKFLRNNHLELHTVHKFFFILIIKT